MTIKISIEISGETPDELTDKMYALTQTFNNLNLGEGGPAPATTAPQRTMTAKPPAAATKTAVGKTPAPKAAPKSPALPDYASEVAPLVLKVAEAAGRDKAIAVMAEFGVTKAPQLSPDQYAEFIAAMNAALEEAEALA